ncbi:MAG TPA: hypothetical protein VF756_02420 [Thermoanaerobaculia bacterium]
MRLKLALSVLAPAAFLLHAATASAAVCGDAQFNDEVHWSTSSAVLEYTVDNAPANTCGDLWANRNGSGWQLEAVDWLCTDSNGDAEKGPWSASSQSGDETAYVYIDYGTCTSPVRKHIWDLADPTVNITSSGGSSFAGNASDGSWGAGFSSSWASCLVKYYDSTDGFYWSPYTGWNEIYPYVIGTTINGMPSLSITWSANQVPATQTGHCYTWYAQCWDGGHWGYDQDSFCK